MRVGKRNRPVHFRVGPLGRIDDFRRALVQHRVVVGLHPDANNFVRMTSHCFLRFLRRLGLRPGTAGTRQVVHLFLWISMWGNH